MKKWTFLLAAGLLAGATPVFTGCIDNDEPEGITILRGAKAELIRAKAAVEKANVLKVEAEAAYKKAEAEVKAAEKLLLEAQAKKLEAETEAAKAKIEAEIKKIEAEAQKELELAKKAAQAAADAHAQALEELRKLQAATAEAQSKALQVWMDKYEEKKAAYDEAYLAWVDASRKYTAQLAKDKQTGKDPDELAQLKWSVKQAEKDLAQAKKYQEELQAELEEAKKMEPAELQVKKEKLQKEMVVAKDNLAKLEVEKAELKRANADKIEAIQKCETALQELENEEIAVPAFSFTFPEIGVPGFQGEEVIIYENQYKFTENRYGGPSNDYFFAERDLNNFKTTIAKLLLDEDDKAWTAARKNELMQQTEGLMATYNEDLKWWNEAVAAYNAGNGVDPTKYSFYKEFVDATKAYNQAAEKYNTQQVAVADAKKALDEAVKKAAQVPEGKDATATLYKEIEAAQAVYTTIEKAEKKKINNLTKEWNVKIGQLERDAQLKGSEWYAAYQRLMVEPNNEKYKAEEERLQKLYDEASKAWTKAKDDKNAAIKKAKAAYDKAIALASIDLYEAEAVARKKFEDQVAAWGATVDPEFTKAVKKAINAAKKQLKEASASVKDSKKAASEALNNNYNAFIKLNNSVSGSFVQNYFQYYSAAYGVFASQYDSKAILFDVKDLVSFNNNTAKALIAHRSRTVFGDHYYFAADMQNDGQYQIPQGHLVALDKAAIETIIKQEMPTIKPYQIPMFYNQFGSYGQTLVNEYDIKVAQAYLDNNKSVVEAMASIDEAIKALEASKVAQDKKIETAIANIDAAQKVVDELLEPLAQKEAEAQAEKALINDVLTAVERALSMSATGQPTVEDIKNYIQNLEAAIEQGEYSVVMKTAAKEKAEALLAKYEAGDYTASDRLKAEMEDAEYKKNEANKALERAAADLNKAIEKIEKAAE